MARPLVALLATFIAFAVMPAAAPAAVCADYGTQAAAQAAEDTRDGDGDGLYCEELPCPCATSAEQPASPTPSAPSPTGAAGPSDCVRTNEVVGIGFSKTKYPNIRTHTNRAIRRGWPRVMVLNRPGADARRDRLLANVPTRDGYDRDEYPAAVGRGKGKGLRRGRNPRGWKADVAYVPSSENRSHGATLGIKLRRFCDGTKFRYVFY